jgi:hypothetical protein
MSGQADGLTSATARGAPAVSQPTASATPPTTAKKPGPGLIELDRNVSIGFVKLEAIREQLDTNVANDYRKLEAAAHKSDQLLQLTIDDINADLLARIELSPNETIEEIADHLKREGVRGGASLDVIIDQAAIYIAKFGAAENSESAKFSQLKKDIKDDLLARMDKDKNKPIDEVAADLKKEVSGGSASLDAIIDQAAIEIEGVTLHKFRGEIADIGQVIKEIRRTHRPANISDHQKARQFIADVKDELAARVGDLALVTDEQIEAQEKSLLKEISDNQSKNAPNNGSGDQEQIANHIELAVSRAAAELLVQKKASINMNGGDLIIDYATNAFVTNEVKNPINQLVIFCNDYYPSYPSAKPSLREEVRQSESYWSMIDQAIARACVDDNGNKIPFANRKDLETALKKVADQLIEPDVRTDFERIATLYISTNAAALSAYGMVNSFRNAIGLSQKQAPSAIPTEN